MALAFEELVEASCDGLDISRVKTKEVFSMLECRGGWFRCAACGPPGPVPIEVVDLDGMNVYLGRVEAEPVTTAIGYRTGREGAIFNVATSAEHRRHGYGAAITAFATRSLFESGADLAWLQTTPMGAGLLPTRIPSGRQSHSAQPAEPPELLTSGGPRPTPSPRCTGLLATEQLFDAGRSRIESKSGSSRAIPRQSSHISIAVRRCSIASAVRPARLSQQATL